MPSSEGSRRVASLAETQQTVRATHHLVQALAITQGQHDDKLTRMDEKLTRVDERLATIEAGMRTIIELLRQREQ